MDCSIIEISGWWRQERLGAAALVAARLRELGYDCIHVGEIGMASAAGEEIITAAKANGDLNKLALKWLGRPAGDLPN